MRKEVELNQSSGVAVLRILGLALSLIFFSSCGGSSGSSPVTSRGGGDTDPPEVQAGERLFLETRFAEFFFANSSENVNAKLAAGDPVVEVVQTTEKPLPGPFRGESMNCRQCHLVDELKPRSRFDVRTYCDFARHSPLSSRADGLLTTPRNSPLLVNATLTRDVPEIFHFDGEFPTIEDLVIGTLTGRNFGWLPSEQATAVAHIARVIRGDDGNNDLAKSFGGGGIPFRTLLLGTDPAIPPQLVIPPQYRIDVNAASDDQVLEAVAALMHAYIDSLRFSTDENGASNGSPYDVFLTKNGLPRLPNDGEANAAYAQRLLGLINNLTNPIFVTPSDGPPSASNGKPEFQLQKNQRFAFGTTELQGLKLFFAQASDLNMPHTGNCVACHAPPDFTDFRFHNTGASQVEYDAIFGDGAFAAIDIPGLSERDGNFDGYLPPSPAHPNANGRFRTPPSSDQPGFADLGVWNVLGNPDMPAPQTALSEIMCSEFGLTGADCNNDALLPLSIGYFKTPTLRDLGQSNPYLHNGKMDTIEDVLNFYVTSSNLARAEKLRNASPELSNMDIDATDVAPIAAFIRALNEDYN